MPSLYAEILEQSQSFPAMLAHYRAHPQLLDIPVQPQQRIVLTGMGSSYHAASITALHLNRLGVRACAYEAVDLLNYAPAMLEDDSLLVYISQSGTSGEVVPLLESLGGRITLVGVTNNPDSPLARRARYLLPMTAGVETLVATKTYIHSLAILWMFARSIASLERPFGSPEAFAPLQQAAECITARLDQAPATAQRLVGSFDPDQPLLFLGHGPHAASARQAAMIMSEWSKVPALPFGIGAFRHGFIETVRPGFGAVLFAPPGPTQASARALAEELTAYGARALLVENGCLRGLEDCPPSAAPLDEFLSPVVDILPIQLYTEALARQRLEQVGFRYIGKVVKQI